MTGKESKKMPRKQRDTAMAIVKALAKNDLDIRGLYSMCRKKDCESCGLIRLRQSARRLLAKRAGKKQK